MATPSIAEAITDSFYAWETRGRGWMLADYPVSLEPPFRPLFLLPQFAPDRCVRIDDGKRPTFASLLFEGARRLLRGTSQADAPEPYEEEPPFPAFEGGPLAALRILVPANYVSRADVIAQLLSALSAALHPISFELIGAFGEVTIQIVCATFDATQVAAHIEGFMPEVAVIPGNDRIADEWDSTGVQRVVDFGLAHEFFLPLTDAAEFRVDPYVPLVAALSRASRGEFLVLQMLFERARNPWATAIHEALDDGDDGCLIGDAPWFLTAAEGKTASPIYATVVRVGAQAGTEERAWELVRSANAFILQYANPSGNALAPLENDGYADDVHAASLLGRTSLRTGMLLSASELVGLVHLPDQSVRHPALSRQQLRSKELPDAARGHALVLGEHRHRGTTSTASLAFESRFAHTWVVGGSGTGKSTLLANLILADIAAGHGVAVLDPHGDLIDDIAARIPAGRIADVILFDPADAEYPIGFNILNAATEIEGEWLSSDLVAIFRRFATSWGDTMSTVLGQAVLALLHHPNGSTLPDLRRFLVDDGFRKLMLTTIVDPDIRFFWEVEYPIIGARSLGPLLSRLDAFLRARIVRNVVGQQNAKLDLADAMRTGKVFLARLAKGQIGEENAYLLGSLLLAKFNQLALMRQAIPKDQRRPFFCYADEFQHFVTPSMESLATEGRKYRFGLILAHQTLAQLAEVPRIESALLANCHTRIVFRVGDGDAKKLADGFAFFEASDLSSQARGEAVVRMGGATNDFNLKTHQLAPIDADGGEARRRAVVAATRERYAVPRAELATPLVSICTPSEERDQASDPKAAVEDTAPPSFIHEPPTRPTTKTPAVARSRTANLMPQPQQGRGGELHKYVQHLIKRLAEERGFRAVIEGTAGEGQADVVLHRESLIVGCEISVTTDATHELGNIRKCLAAGFNRVLFISSEKRQRDKIAAMLRVDIPSAPIDVIGPEDIVTALDAFGSAPRISESVVRGYKVKVTRQELSPEDEASRRSAIAGVIARGMRK